MSQEFQLVDNAASLADDCGSRTGKPWVALDTEFMRERTYYPLLCLVQLADDESVSCVDTLQISDTAPLQNLLLDSSVTKVIHAARQDLEALLPLAGAVPGPVFDTQIAAALLGFSEQIGYATLVEALLGVTLPKEHQRTDWSRRPIEADKLAYAANDVRYLREVYTILMERLTDTDRLSWLEQECAAFADPRLYLIEPELAYLRVKRGATLSAAQQQVLRELAAWREETAQRRDLPRNWVAKDDVLIYLAQATPATRTELEKVRGLEAAVLKRHGEDILAAIARGRGHEPRRLFRDTEPLSPAQIEMRERLQAAVRSRAAELDIREPVLATRRDLDGLVRGEREDNALLIGWRRQAIGEELLTLL
jgi:ribonuclease D